MVATLEAPKRYKPAPTRVRGWQYIRDCRYFACDTETTGLHPYHTDRPFAFSFYTPTGKSCYIEFGVDPYSRKVIVPKIWRKRLKRVFRDPSRVVIFHNAKFDLRMIERLLKIRFRCKIQDTLYAARVCDTLEAGRKHESYGLKPLSDKYLGISEADLVDLKKKVAAARRQGKKLGMKLGLKYNWLEQGGRNGNAAPSDYWLPRVFDHEDTSCEVYAVLDAERTMKLWLMYRILMTHMKQWKTYNREVKLIRVVKNMEDRGLMINLEGIKKEDEKACEIAAKEILTVRQTAGKEFNPNSHPQLRKLLYETLGLPVEHWTKGPKDKEDHIPQPSTGWKVLAANSKIPTIAALLRYRSAMKNASSFMRLYLSLAAPDPYSDGYCLHPSYNQAGTCTGRFSSSGPNLQNVSYGMTAAVRGIVPFSARMAFKPRPGYVLVFMDFQQLEARLFADVSQEPFMKKAFYTGRDFHTECCNRAWGGVYNPEGCLRNVKYILVMDKRGIRPSEKVLEVWRKYHYAGLNDLDKLGKGGTLSDKSLQDSERVALAMIAEFKGDLVELEASIGEKVSRSKAKALFFNLIYGGGVQGAANHMECDIEEAKQFLLEYKAEFPRIVEYMTEMQKFAKANGYVLNKAGRRLTVHPQKAYRATNYTIQSLAADLMKRAMLRIQAYFDRYNIDAYMLATIHDEIMFEIREDLVMDHIVDRKIDSKGKEKIYLDSPLVKKITRLMEDNAGWVDIHLPVEIAISPETWDKKIAAEIVKDTRGTHGPASQVAKRLAA
jgi:DNA polymerase I-like protein with 3'-5' exonuclease and polymerase domains